MLHALLSEGAKIDLQTTDGMTPLYAACQNGHIEVVRALLSSRAKIDLRTKGDGRSPLHVACQQGHTEVVLALLSRGAEVDLQSKDDACPLHLACQNGHMDTVCALLSSGAKVNRHAVKAGTPMHLACHNGHFGVVRALLSAGARTDLRDMNGRMPLDLLPCVLRAEVERLEQLAKERGSAKADESRVGAPSAPAAVLPHQSASQLQAACEDGGEGSSEAPGGLSAEASSISGRATSGRVCSMCGGPPTASASSGGEAKLKACGRCMSVRYCSQECQRKHWGEGGHKAACSQLRERERRKAGCEG